jgi:hypothetical protein
MQWSDAFDSLILDSNPIALNTMNSLYRPVAREIDGLILV